MITPSICKLQKKFEQENNICKIIQNTFLSVRIKIDNSKNKFFYDNIELVINDEGVGYSVMTSIELSDSLEFNASATKLLNELNQIILPTSNPNYTPCDITIANRIPQIAIISKVIEKIDADEQDINNLYAECLSLCDLSLSFIETLQKRLESNESKIQESTSGCYIATSVYGSYDCPQVWTLRRYRDYNLSNTLLLKFFRGAEGCTFPYLTFLNDNLDNQLYMRFVFLRQIQKLFANLLESLLTKGLIFRP